MSAASCPHWNWRNHTEMNSFCREDVKLWRLDVFICSDMMYSWLSTKQRSAPSNQLPPHSVLCCIIKRTNQTEHHHLRLLLSDGTTNLQPSCSWMISVVSVSEKIWIQHELLCNWLKTINRQPHLIYFPISLDIFRGLYTVQRQSVAADTDLVNGLLTRVIGPVVAAMMSV